MAGINFREAKGDTVLASLRSNLYPAVLALATDLDLAVGPAEVRG